jgi:uncharacterized DUF497 family protein
MRIDEFEWDDNKNRINIAKHGISLKDARFAFYDPHKVEMSDFSGPNEERWKIIGMVDKLLLVVYTERGERIRLISARAATRAEQEEYNACNS